MKENFLNIDWLKKNHKMIHYFGLGFIQIKLDDFNRLHFYTDIIDKTVKEEEIHNHRYNFSSTILRGHFKQEIYELDMSGKSHYLTQDTCNVETKQEFPKIDCSIKRVFEKEYFPDESYFIDHNTFHTVSAFNAITHVHRSSYKKDLADIVFKKEQTIVCPFSANRKPEELFEIVNSMLHYGISH